MGAAKNLIGMRFGRLTVVSLGESLRRANGKTRRRWNCVCECGNDVLVRTDSLLSGGTQSCGCLQRERASETMKTHGGADSRLYNVWCTIKQRCYNPKNKAYHRYGGRGIVMCDDWKDSFESFRDWAMQNGYDSNANRGICTIDRIDNDGKYEPSNCRWVSQQEQMNNVSYNHDITYNGETHTLAEWARLFDIPYSKLSQRINRYGYDIAKALLTD